MIHVFIILGLLCSAVWTTLPLIKAQEGAPPVSEETQRRVLDVWRHQEEEIRKNPDVLGATVSPTTGEIVIESDRPAGVPTEIEGVPVKVLPPPPMLPPPPGVIVLRPGGEIERREGLDACPDGFKEVSHYRWRFCQPLIGNPEPIPGHLLNLPVAGIPYEKAEEIVKRNLELLFKLPGVHGVGMGKDGIWIETDNPAVLPKEVEGLPIEAVPYEGPGIDSSHSTNEKIRPLHGAVSIRDALFSPSAGGATLTGIALSQGKPWLILPAPKEGNFEKMK